MKKIKKAKGKKGKGIMIRLFEEKGGVDLGTVRRDLRIKGFFVEEIEKAKHHLEITVNPKKREEVEKILEEYGCYRMSSKPQKNCNQTQQSQLITA